MLVHQALESVYVLGMPPQTKLYSLSPHLIRSDGRLSPNRVDCQNLRRSSACCEKDTRRIELVMVKHMLGWGSKSSLICCERSPMLPSNVQTRTSYIMSIESTVNRSESAQSPSSTTLSARAPPSSTLLLLSRPSPSLVLYHQYNPAHVVRP